MKALPEVIEFVEYQVLNKKNEIIGMGITYFGNPLEVVCQGFSMMYPNGEVVNCLLSYDLREFTLRREGEGMKRES